MATPAAASTLRRTLLAGAALAALGAGALATQDAQAAFVSARCSGAANVGGRGSSFQATLQTRFKTLYESSQWCNGASGPLYTSTGSGDGKAAMGAGGGDLGLPKGERLATVSFAGTDEPPTPAELRLIDDGPTTGTADDGVLHTIPIATGSSAFIVHVPEGCLIDDPGVNKTNGADGAFGGVNTGDQAGNKTQRVRISSTLLEAAFAGADNADTWGEIVPGISGNASGSATDDFNAGEPCASVPVRRIVRFDNSGTTFGWKAYLSLINPNRRWTTDYGVVNTVWPAAGGTGRANPVATTGRACDNPNNLCSGAARGGGNEAKGVSDTDGSIGYVDLATARSNGFDVIPSADRQDSTYWSPLQVLAGAQRDTYAEPTQNAAGHLSTSTVRGASCSSAPVVNGPESTARSPNGDPTLADWSAAFAAGGNGYPACVLTYVMAWDDNAPVYGVNDSEQAKARTVKDYVDLLVSEVGQNNLLASDYSPLPNSDSQPIVRWAQLGASAIDWNKNAGNVVVNPPVIVPPVVRPPVAPPVAPAAPSNAFSVPSSRVTSSLMTFTLQLPGKGLLKVAATTKVGKRTVKVASASASPKGAGKVTLRLKLSSAAKKALARAKSKKIKVAVKFTFTPAGGKAKSVTKTVTVRAAKKPVKRAARRHSKKSVKH